MPMGQRLYLSLAPYRYNTQQQAEYNPWAIPVGMGSPLCFSGFFPFCSEAVLSRKDSGGSLLQLSQNRGQVLGVTVHPPGLTVGESTPTQSLGSPEE